MTTPITGTLTRNAYLEHGTFGRLTLGTLDLFTVEQPWRNNERGASCIPDGSYLVRRHVSPTFGPCWILLSNGLYATDEEATAKGGRSHILIHPANWPDQLRGCIAPGRSFGVIQREGRPPLKNLGVSSSQRACVLIDRELEGVNEWVLEIKSFEAK